MEIVKDLIKSKIKFNIKLNNGNLISNKWFDGVWRDLQPSECYVISKDRTYNIYSIKNEKFASKKWFNYVSGFYNENFRVKLNEKWNFVNGDGVLVSSVWFEYVNSFVFNTSDKTDENYYARVVFKGEIYELDTNGNLRNCRYLRDTV